MALAGSGRKAGGKVGGRCGVCWGGWGGDAEWQYDDEMLTSSFNLHSRLPTVQERWLGAHVENVE